MVSSEYSSLINRLLERQQSAEVDPAVQHLVGQFDELVDDALFIGEFTGGGYYLQLFLYPDGRSANFNMLFDEVNEYTDSDVRDWALRIGSGRYPELVHCITPRPSTGTTTCIGCEGTGWSPEAERQTACADCNGRGWRSSEDV